MLAFLIRKCFDVTINCVSYLGKQQQQGLYPGHQVHVVALDRVLTRVLLPPAFGWFGHYYCIHIANATQTYSRQYSINRSHITYYSSNGVSLS